MRAHVYSPVSMDSEDNTGQLGSPQPSRQIRQFNAGENASRTIGMELEGLGGEFIAELSNTNVSVPATARVGA